LIHVSLSNIYAMTKTSIAQTLTQHTPLTPNNTQTRTTSYTSAASTAKSA
jgi:hypothetical protein